MDINKKVGDNMKTLIEITGSDSEYNWYNNCIGKQFIVQSESRKGGKGNYVVRIPKEDRHLMNGYMYGWVSIKDCKIIST